MNDFEIAKITITQFEETSLWNTRICICKLRVKKNLNSGFCWRKHPGNIGSFGVLIRTWVQGAVCTRNAALKVGCSWLSACIVKLGYLVKVPPPSQRSVCMYIDARTRIARTHSTRLVRILGLRVRARGEILPDSVARSVNVLHCVIRHGLWDNVVP